MSVEQAEAFMNRVESDEAFAAELESLKDDQAAVQAAVVAAGFDATPDEIRDAFVGQFGDQLTEEQLAAIAGGVDDAWSLSLPTSDDAAVAMASAAV